jgi:4-hydroxybenzoate polyprenyltransferase
MNRSGLLPVERAEERALPLCVDLDGTLLESDTLYEAVIALVRSRPLAILQVFLWALRGKAYLKSRVADESPLDVTLLPVREDFLDFLEQEFHQGRHLILATATHHRFAGLIADRFGIFSDVVATSATCNLSGKAKSQALCERFGRGGFDYAANAFADLPVWQDASEAILVNATSSLGAALSRKRISVSRVFQKRSAGWKPFIRAIRMHQWAKNALIFAPILLSHNIANIQKVSAGLVAFLAFSLCASGVYLLNDLLDLESDRRHPKKRLRPLAAGLLSIPAAVCAVPALTAAAFALGYFMLGSPFVLVLAAYLAATIAYSFWLKRVLLVDVIALASLYTLRIIAGGVATHITVSPWTFLFSASLFLSLALMKRYSELISLKSAADFAHGRAYRAADASILASAGLASGYASVVVMALYINSPEVTLLYPHPVWIWPICLLQSYFISRFWLLAHRGAVQDDPVVVALKDKVTYMIAAVSLLFIILATGLGF